MKTNLAVKEETKIALKSVSRKAISVLKKKYADVTEIKDSASMALAIAGRAEHRNIRVALDKERKAVSEDARGFINRVNSEAKELTAMLSETEDRLNGLIRDVEEKKAARKAEKDRLEKERIVGIQEKIQEIHNSAVVTYDSTAMSIESAIKELVADPVKVEVYAEFAEQAGVAKDESLAFLRKAFETVKAREERDERIETARKEGEERQAKIDIENQKEKDRLAKEQEKLDKEKAAIAEKQRKIDEEENRKKIAAEEKVKAEKEAEAKLKRDEESRAIKEQVEREEKAKIAAEKPDKEKLFKFADDILAGVISSLPALKTKKGQSVGHDVVGKINEIQNFIHNRFK